MVKLLDQTLGSKNVSAYAYFNVNGFKVQKYNLIDHEWNQRLANV